MTVQDRILLDPVSVPAAVKPHLSGSKQEAVAAEDRPDQIGLAETYGWKRTNDRGYSILEQPLGTLRPLRIIHIGAGASGICFSKFAADELRDASWVCYEKNEDVGGTWLENRYPGCACDIPSANYQFTWARNPDWSQYYSTSPEIWKYFKNLTEQYDLMKYIKLGHQVTGAFWDEDKGKWYVKVKVKATGEEIEDTCDVLINGGGVLNKWKWPRIEGLHTFEGKLMHSAAYEEGYPLDGKRVAVVGIGSSGVQIVPNIVDSVEKLYVWIRSPTWITAGFGQRFAGPNGHNFHYSEDQKADFRKNPQKFLKYSKLIETELNQRFSLILKNTPEAKAALEYSAKEMVTKLGGHQELVDAIVPKNFGVGCRRPTPGNGFLESLTRDNVDVFTKEMRSITKRGFIDADGQEHEVDVIICATGFDTTWVPRFPVVANGINLQDTWQRELKSYLSIAAPEMPNYWLSGGPYSPTGHGSFLPLIECIMKNVIECIQKMQKERIKSMTPKMEVIDAFSEHAQLFLQRTAWTGPCSSWFKQGRTDGPLTIWPGSRLSFFEMVEKARFEDYEIKYLNRLNPLEFMGNGFTVREKDGRDISYYLGMLNGEDRRLNLEEDI